MIQRLLTSAVGAGVAAWLLAALLHFAFVQDYILLGEAYETGTAVHFGGAGAGHDHGEGAQAHDHDHGDPASAGTRNFWTVVFYGLVYIGYAMVLVAGFGLAAAYGKVITATEGLVWGIGGFAAFQLAPAMGLAPELPGTPGADLTDRQVWWWGTALATGLGLAALAYGRGIAAVALGVTLLAAPHVIGAPGVEGFDGVAPPEVAAAFAARVLGVALVVWALMGWVAGYLWSRADRR
jgi:cobalt transporter subunit CbtA